MGPSIASPFRFQPRSDRRKRRRRPPRSNSVQLRTIWPRAPRIRKVPLGVGGGAFKQRHSAAPLRIADDSEAANTRTCRRPPVIDAARFANASALGVDVLDADIADPARPARPVAWAARSRRRSASLRAKKRISHAGHAGILRAPADDIAVKSLRGHGIGRRHGTRRITRNPSLLFLSRRTLE